VIALAAAAVFTGAALQSATGFGFALVSAPLLFAIVGPREAVTAGALLGIALNLLTLTAEGRVPRVLRRDAVALLAWSLPGLVLGAVALRELPGHLLSVLVALAVLAAVGLRRWGPARADAGVRRSSPRWHVAAAGAGSGALATSTSLSGPPLVFYLLEAGAGPGQMRDTLAAVFLALSVVGLPVLVATGTFALPAGLGALVLAGAAGQLLGRRGFAWLGGERYETAVLALLTATALVALATSGL
jgi:uncharacterized membrane protein YfcA